MENEYKLHDFYQAVILLTAGLLLTRLERGNGNKFVNFIFDDTQGVANSILQRYWSRELKLVAKDLIQNIVELKTRIYSGV